MIGTLLFIYLWWAHIFASDYDWVIVIVIATLEGIESNLGSIYQRLKKEKEGAA